MHQRLVAAGLRTLASILVESDEPRESHHFACLLGYGADAICPRLALETRRGAGGRGPARRRPSLAGEAQRRFREAVEDGVLKIMSKMGISDVASYRGAQVFEALGLAPEVVERCFTGHAVPLGGIGFARARAEALRERAAALRRDRSSRTRAT